ncbi:DotA/TraY family protein [Nguyenibacter vanlangensis]|uniref:DotA/TraY family protein n=1 Tax=Nguyenibacter vanlangensis TaxID=1216886 RepID=A0ABZ3D361_9PROT
MKKLVFIAALFAAFPTLAHAAATITADEATCSASGTVLTQTLTAPCASDWWRQSLELIFPGVGPLNGNASQAAQGLFSASGGFLAVLSAVAVAMLAWHAISGTVATAHEGTILGQNWHTVWAPLRLCFGFGMLAPAKGVCLAQVLVIYVALYGGSLGNLVWSRYSAGLVTPSLNAPPLPATGALVRDFTEAELCRQSLIADGALTGPLFDLPTTMPGETVGGTTGENIEVSLGNLYNSIAARFTGGNLTSSAQSNRHLIAWNYGVCGTISGTFAVGSGGDSTVTAFDKARLAAIEQARDAISGGVAQFIDYQKNPVKYEAQTPTYQVMDMARTGFTKAISDAKSTLDTKFQAAGQVLIDAQDGNNSNVSSFLNDGNKYGWMTAGMFYMSIARLQSAAYSLASDIPQVSIPPMSATDKSEHIDLKTWSYAGNYVKAGEAALQPLTIQWNASDDTADLRNAALAGSTQGSTASLHSVQKWLFDKIFSIGNKYLVGINPANGSPIQQLADFGNEVLNTISIVVLGGLAGGTMLGGPAGAAALAGAVASGPLSFVGIIIGMLLLVGVEHAYIIPMMPFIEFTFAAIGILITVVEAFMVLPVWAFMHVRMDGSEFVNEQQKSGYVLLLSLFLRIPLTVFGLILSLQIMNAGVWLVSRSFSVAALAGTADSGPGIIGAVVMLVLEAWMTWKITTASLRLMTSIPELAGKIIGWASDSLRTESPSHFVGGVVGRTAGGAGHGIAKVGEKGAGGKGGSEEGGQGAGGAGGGMATTERPVSS